MANNSSIIDKVNFIMLKSKSGNYTAEELETIISYVPLHSTDLVLGRVFGYSISDYAIASLKWIGTDETIELYNNFIKAISPDRIDSIRRLIDSKPYLQF
jgi:hypothetical protein